MIALLLGLVVVIWLVGFLLGFLCGEEPPGERTAAGAEWECPASSPSWTPVPALSELEPVALPSRRERVLVDTTVLARVEEDGSAAGFQ